MHKGGDGIIRDIEFLEPNIHLSILSERRVFSPYGMNGGDNGEKGLNLWIRKDEGLKLNLGGKNTAKMSVGDRIQILTPGGGGWGNADRKFGVESKGMESRPFLMSGSVDNYRLLQESA